MLRYSIFTSGVHNSIKIRHQDNLLEVAVQLGRLADEVLVVRNSGLQQKIIKLAAKVNII